MAVLCGFMLGSLRKIWPFQRDVTWERLDHVGISAEKIAEIRQDPTLVNALSMSHRAFEPYLPASLDSSVLMTLGFAVAACLLVFALDWASAKKMDEPLRAEDHEPGE